jgi:hypothetical protein
LWKTLQLGSDAFKDSVEILLGESALGESERGPLPLGF